MLWLVSSYLEHEASIQEEVMKFHLCLSLTLRFMMLTVLSLSCSTDWCSAPKIETSRWCDDIKPRDGDETNVRSRIVVQQTNVAKRDEVHQGTPPKELRMHIDVRCVESGTSAWHSFILRWMSSRWCDHRVGCE